MNYWLNRANSFKIIDNGNSTFTIKKGLGEILIDLKIYEEARDNHGICCHCEIGMIKKMELEFSEENSKIWWSSSTWKLSEEEKRILAESLKRTSLSKEEYFKMQEVMHLFRKHDGKTCWVQRDMQRRSENKPLTFENSF